MKFEILNKQKQNYLFWNIVFPFDLDSQRISDFITYISDRSSIYVFY